MEVSRYFSGPMMIKITPDPSNEITKVIRTPMIIPAVRIFRRRFLRAASASYRHSLRMAFTSLRSP
jgi:hypothetical protein